MHYVTRVEELGKCESLEGCHFLGLVHNNANEDGKTNEKSFHALVC